MAIFQFRSRVQRLPLISGNIHELIAPEIEIYSVLATPTTRTSTRTRTHRSEPIPQIYSISAFPTSISTTNYQSGHYPNLGKYLKLDKMLVEVNSNYYCFQQQQQQQRQQQQQQQVKQTYYHDYDCYIYYSPTSKNDLLSQKKKIALC